MSERTIEWADGGNDGTRGVAPHFDEVIHAPIRLRICGLLSASDSVRFDVLRDTLGISDATCSKHLKTLADAGYVAIAKKPGVARRLLYRDLGRLRHDWVMLTFVVIGGAMPWISLIRDGIERADAAAATVGLAAALASMLMIVVPPVISGLVGGDRSDGVLETFRFSGRPMGEYVAEKLLLGTVPVAGYTVVILLVAARVIGVTDAGLIAFTLTATVLFCVFTTLGALLTGGNVVIGMLVSVVVLAGLAGSRFVLTWIPLAAKMMGFVVVAAGLVAVAVAVFDSRFVDTRREL